METKIGAAIIVFVVTGIYLQKQQMFSNTDTFVWSALLALGVYLVV